MPRVLVIEDARVLHSLEEGLRTAGFEVETAATGDKGARLATSQPFDCIVLDWMLPGRDGLQVLSDLRRSGRITPVLLLTARDAIEDRVLGLESGADDYLVKPFAFAELVARIRTLLRRAGPIEPLRKSISDLIMDLETRRVLRGGKTIDLTPREFDLLVYLMRHPGQVVTREMLANEVWSETNRVTPLDNVTDVHVAHLRKKLDDGKAIKLL